MSNPRRRPGLSVHWIQAKKAAETRREAEAGRIVRIDERGIHVEVDGELRRYAVGDIKRFEELVDRLGPKVQVQQRWSLMRGLPH